LEQQHGFWDNLSPLTKAATLLFAMGKMAGIMSILSLFVIIELAFYMGIVYASLIGMSALLCLIQLFRPGQQENKPTREQVEAWAREYSLLEGK
jgi:hypothetical protein